MDAARRRPRRRRSRYVRFVVGGQRDNPFELSGVFAEAAELERQNLVAPHEAERLRRLFGWFNEHLPTPPFRANLERGVWPEGAVAWYRDDAIWMIRRTWELAGLLREHGRPVRFVQSESPGWLLYEDEYQVVAESRAGRPYYPWWGREGGG